MEGTLEERLAPGIRPRHARLLIAAILLFAFVLRFHTLGVRPLWDDEAWTMSFVYLDDPWRMIRFGLARFHPPQLLLTHYLVSWICGCFFGTTVFALRATSAILGVLAVASIYGTGSALFAPEVGLIAAAFSAVNVLQIIHSQELRMYPLFLVLSWSSIGCFVRACRTRRWSAWAVYGAVSLLLIYTHNYAVFVLAAEALYVIFNPGTRGAVTALLVRLSVFWAAAYAPAALVFARSQLSARPMAGGVFQEANVASLVLTYEHLTLRTHSSELFVAGVVPFILFAAGYALSKRQLRAAGVLVGFLACAPLLVWCFSPPVPFGPEKYFIFASPALLLLLGLGMVAIRSGVLRSMVVASLLVASLPALSSYYGQFTRPPYDQAAEYVRSTDPRPSLVFVSDGLRVFSYYYLGEFPRLRSREWASFVKRVPRRQIALDPAANDLLRPSPSDDMYAERIAPGLFWSGASIAETVRSLDDSIAEFWLVTEREARYPQELSDPRYRLVVERAFGTVSVSRYTLVR